MRKIIFMAVLAIAAMTFNICSANDYDNNPDYTYVITANQGTYYLNIKTLDVVKYRPPQYQIAGSFIHVSPQSDGTEKVTSRYVLLMFDFDSKEVFNKDTYGNWEKSNTEGETTNAKVNRKFADALFRAAYGQDFFGY
ncbi:MAG: hypothetical protein IKZ58_03395 [Selenomonadaceae bacterium]|nr:hypothetical protein [Selenomonadaceae bacterium]